MSARIAVREYCAHKVVKRCCFIRAETWGSMRGRGLLNEQIV